MALGEGNWGRLKGWIKYIYNKNKIVETINLYEKCELMQT